MFLTEGARRRRSLCFWLRPAGGSCSGSAVRWSGLAPLALLFLIVLVPGSTAEVSAPKAHETGLGPIDQRAFIPSSDFKPSLPGEWLSSVDKANLLFDELIYSWSARLPKGEGFRLYFRVGFDSGDSSPWLYGGYWGEVPLEEGKRSNPKFVVGAVSTVTPSSSPIVLNVGCRRSIHS